MKNTVISKITGKLWACLCRLVRPRWRNPDRKLVPPIETHGCANFWFKHGCPEKIGSKILVEMKSGRRAIFRLTKVKYNWDVDWNWYTFEFVDYLTNVEARQNEAQPRD